MANPSDGVVVRHLPVAEAPNSVAGPRTNWHVARALHRRLNSTKKKASRLGLHLGSDDRWSQKRYAN